jgi:hypothetical protein
MKDNEIWAYNSDRKTRNAYIHFLWKPLRICSLERPNRTREDNFKMDPRKTDYEDGRWMEMVQNCVQWWVGRFWFLWHDLSNGKMI